MSDFFTPPPPRPEPAHEFELAAEPLLEAAAQSEQLWPGGEPSGGGVVIQQQAG